MTTLDDLHALRRDFHAAALRAEAAAREPISTVGHRLSDEARSRLTFKYREIARECRALEREAGELIADEQAHAWGAA